MSKSFSKSGHRPDYTFLSCVVLLVIFGLVMLSSASSDLGKNKFNDTYYYLRHQILYGLSFGIVGFLIASRLHYRYWQKIATLLLIINVIALILVFTPLGVPHGQAKRWLDIGPISIQPSELLKFVFMVYLAAWLASRGKSDNRQKKFFTGYLPFLAICGLVGFLVFSQPSTTTTGIILFSALLVYFASGAKLRYILLTIILGVAGVYMLLNVTKDYRLERLINFMQQETNLQTKGFHLNQSLIAIGSGGWFGVGFGKSIAKSTYLPEPIGDSIFAVIAEELGFIGVLVLMAIFLVLIIRGLSIAKNSRDQFARLAVIGFISVIAIQTAIHLAANSGLMPLTGVPLPFISYGGSSLAVFLTMAGAIGNISKYTS